MTNTPIMFLPGFPQQPPAWQAVITACAQRGIGGRWFAPWIPGAGPRDDGFDLDAAVGRLATQIDLQAGGRADVVGLDLGGLVGLALAARCPELVRRLVVINTTPKPGRLESWAARAVLRGRPGVASSGLPARRLRDTFRAISGLDLRPELGRISCPVLVVAGTQDAPRVAAAQLLATAIPGASRVTVPGGRWLNQEQPNELVDSFAAFLTDDAAPSGPGARPQGGGAGR